MELFTFKKLDLIRKEIDIVDEHIVELFAKRSELVEQIAEVKKEGLCIRDKIREHQILTRLCNLAIQKGINVSIIKQVYPILFNYSVELQNKKLRPY